MTPINSKIRIGVIGAGAFAVRQHLPCLVKSSYAKIVALYQQNQEMLAKIAVEGHLLDSGSHLSIRNLVGNPIVTNYSFRYYGQPTPT